MLKEVEKEKQQWDFFIEEDLPIDSDIVLDFTLGIDEVFEVKAYPKTNKAKSKNIVLARGNKDSKTLDFLSSSLEKILGSNFTEAQRDYFFKSAKKEIEQINNIGVDNHDSEKWDEIRTTIFTHL
jgi:molecular chaperone DnaK